MLAKTWDRMILDEVIDRRADAEIEAMAQLARKHFAIVVGDQCPACDSTNTEANDESANCLDCLNSWDFSDWREVEVFDGKLYPVGF